jgi:hypothetical protein
LAAARRKEQFLMSDFKSLVDSLQSTTTTTIINQGGVTRSNRVLLKELLNELDSPTTPIDRVLQHLAYLKSFSAGQRMLFKSILN